MSSAPNPIIVLSAKEHQLLSYTMSRASIRVLPNCVPLKEATEFQRSNSTTDALTVLFLGRITHDKGIDAVFQAFAYLRTQGTRTRFVIAGKGAEEQVYVGKFVELLGNDFEFKGVVADGEKIALLKRCQVFLLPSSFEGMPMALLESMSFGLVPIATNVGSIGSIITHDSNGIIVNQRAPDEIASAIEHLARDRKYLQMLSTNARQYILTHYDRVKYLDSLNAIYRYE